jgi:DNA-binding protein HU-beta
MTKAELIEKVAADAGITKKQAGEAVASVFGNITAALKAGDKITLIGFGTFKAVKKAARTGRNPQTGGEIKIAAKTVGKFSAGSVLKDLTAKPAVKKVAPARKATPAKKTAPAKGKKK